MPKKGDGEFADLTGMGEGVGKKKEVVFLREGGESDIPMHTMIFLRVSLPMKMLGYIKYLFLS